MQGCDGWALQGSWVLDAGLHWRHCMTGLESTFQGVGATARPAAHAVMHRPWAALHAIAISGAPRPAVTAWAA